MAGERWKLAALPVLLDALLAESPDARVDDAHPSDPAHTEPGKNLSVDVSRDQEGSE